MKKKKVNKKTPKKAVVKDKMMSKEDAVTLLHKIDYEGFGYCFTDYSSWDDIKDKKFQALKKAFVEANSNLEEYVQDLRDEYEIEPV